MSRSEALRRTVLVTDAGQGNALAIIRSLGRSGWRVIAADTTPRSLGFRSRYVAERGYCLHTVPEYGERLTAAGFVEVQARDWTERFIDIHCHELERLRTAPLASDDVAELEAGRLDALLLDSFRSSSQPPDVSAP